MPLSSYIVTLGPAEPPFYCIVFEATSDDAAWRYVRALGGSPGRLYAARAIALDERQKPDA